MPDNWIGTILLTGETEVSVGGEKVHDLISCDQEAVVEVDKALYPVLWDKLGGTDGDPMSDLVFAHVILTEDKYDPTLKRFACTGSGDRDYVSKNINSTGVFTDNGLWGENYVMQVSTSSSHVYNGPIVSGLNLGADLTFEVAYSIFGAHSNQYQRGTLLLGFEGSYYPPEGDKYIKHIAIWLNSTRNSLLVSVGTKRYMTVTVPSVGNFFVSLTVLTTGVAYLHINGEVVAEVVDWNWGNVVSTNHRLGGGSNVDHKNVGFSMMRITEGIRYPQASYTIPTEQPVGEGYSPYLPNMTRPVGSPHPYKIIADKSEEPPLDAVIFGGEGLDGVWSGGSYYYSSTNELTYLYPNPLAINWIYVEQTVDGSSYLYIQVDGEKPAGSTVVFKLLDEAGVEVVDHVLEYSHYNSGEDYTKYFIDSYDVEYVANVIYNSIQAGTTLRLRTTYVE